MTRDRKNFIEASEPEARRMTYGYGLLSREEQFFSGRCGLLRKSISELTCLEIHGPEEELAKLREHLAALHPKFFVLECGFRR